MRDHGSSRKARQAHKLLRDELRSKCSRCCPITGNTDLSTVVHIVYSSVYYILSTALPTTVRDMCFKNLAVKKFRLFFFKFKNLQLSICAQ